MTAQIPSRETGYAADNTLELTPEVWNGVFGDIHDRLAEIEGRAEDLQAVIDAGTSQALAMIATNVAPEIQSARDFINQVRSDLQVAQAQILADLAVAQAQIDELIANGAPAVGVTVSTISGLSAANAQAAFAEHQGDIDALAATVAGHTSSIATNTSGIAANTSALAGKAPQATTYTKTEVDALIANNATSIARIMAFSS